MGYRRPKSDPAIFGEWEAIIEYAQPGRLEKLLPLHEQRKRWQKLYETYFVDGQWTCSVFDAGLISSLGVTVLFESGEYELARRVNKEYLLHPALTPTTSDPKLTKSWLCRTYPRTEVVGVVQAFEWDAKLALLMGQIDEGVALVRQALSEAKGYFGHVFRYGNWFIPWVLSTEPPDAVADPRLKELAIDLAQHQREPKRFIEALRQAQTNRVLLKVLDPEGTDRRPDNWPR